MTKYGMRVGSWLYKQFLNLVTQYEGLKFT